MARGRPKKSKALDDLHGNPGKRKKEKSTFTAQDGRFGIPKGLNQEVRVKVRKLANYLYSQGVPTDFIRPMFERYCKHLQTAYLAAKELKTGLTIDGRKKPEALIWKDESAAASRIEAQIINILKNSNPLPPAETELEKFKKAGRKIEVIKQ